MKLLENMSVREKELWGELLIDLLVALYYFPKAIQLVAQDDSARLARDLAGLVSSTIVLSIVAAIIVFGAIHASGQVEQKDERDHRFESGGNRLGYWCLNLLLGAILVLLVSTEYHPVALPGAMLAGVGALGVGHLILLAMVLASTVKVLTQLYHYRRSA